uniref:5'-3' exoribonuclease 1-like isoform X2 n=1 Tax=Scatophagus argus TaxID=75038 RepID=UPI001ED838C7|nr:5'-3' exoribonuclease 1-like isoform X2 [Scatophagus argus]
MLKIDSTGTGSLSSQEAANSSAPGGQQQNRRRSSKKLANMNAPHGDTAVLASPTSVTSANHTNAVLTSKVSELARVCVGLGMAPPEFSYIGNRQGVVVCQVKLSNGLMVHGPQCQSENDAKEKAAFFALQRLNSLGSGSPLPPPIYPGVGQIRPPPIGAMPPVFSQQGGLLLPPQGYAPAPLWGMTPPPHHHQNQPFYGAAGTFPGSSHHQPAAALPIGSHNQFIPLQVTKKRVSANKKKQETQEFYSASQTVAKHQSQKAQKQPSGQSQAQSGDVIPPHQHTANSIQPTSSPSPGLADTVSTTTAAPHTPVRISEVSVFFCKSYNFWASDIVSAICMKYELINKSRKNNGKQILKCKTSNINSARKKKPKHRGSRVFFRHGKVGFPCTFNTFC